MKKLIQTNIKIKTILTIIIINLILTINGLYTMENNESDSLNNQKIEQINFKTQQTFSAMAGVGLAHFKDNVNQRIISYEIAIRYTNFFAYNGNLGFIIDLWTDKSGHYYPFPYDRNNSSLYYLNIAPMLAFKGTNFYYGFGVYYAYSFYKNCELTNISKSTHHDFGIVFTLNWEIEKNIILGLRMKSGFVNVFEFENNKTKKNNLVLNFFVGYNFSTKADEKTGQKTKEKNYSFFGLFLSGGGYIMGTGPSDERYYSYSYGQSPGDFVGLNFGLRTMYLWSTSKTNNTHFGVTFDIIGELRGLTGDLTNNANYITTQLLLTFKYKFFYFSTGYSVGFRTKYEEEHSFNKKISTAIVIEPGMIFDNFIDKLKLQIGWQIKVYVKKIDVTYKRYDYNTHSYNYQTLSAIPFSFMGVIALGF